MNLPQLQADYVRLRDDYEAFGPPQTDEELEILVKVGTDLELMAACIRLDEESLMTT